MKLAHVLIQKIGDTRYGVRVYLDKLVAKDEARSLNRLYIGKDVRFEVESIELDESRCDTI